MPGFGKWIAAGLLLMTSGVAFSQEMTFKRSGTGGNCFGCEWVAAEGEITADTPERLREFLENNRAGHFVFHSPGGNLVAALEMGLLLRESKSSSGVGRTVDDGFGWKTTVDGHCASACAFAFIGGVDRSAKAGEIGVHQFYSEMSLERPDEPIYSALDISSNQLLSALLINYAMEMGVDPRFISKASSVPPTGMHFLDDAELDEWKVRYDPSFIGAWRIEPWRQGIVAFAKSADDRTTATVFCTSDRVPQLLVSQREERISEEEFLNPASVVRSISVFGQSVHPSDVSTTLSKGVYSLRIRMPGFDARKLPDSGEIGIEADVPRVASMAFHFPMQAAGAKANIGVALRNCF